MEGMLIGDQLKAARKLRGIKTTRVLAGMVDKPRFGEKVIGQIERNEREAREHEVEWLSEALSVPTAYLTTTPEPTGEDDLAGQLAAIDQRLARLEGFGNRIEGMLVQGTDLVERLDRLDTLAGVVREDIQHRQSDRVSIIERLDEIEKALKGRVDDLEHTLAKGTARTGKALRSGTSSPKRAAPRRAPKDTPRA